MKSSCHRVSTCLSLACKMVVTHHQALLPLHHRNHCYWPKSRHRGIIYGGQSVNYQSPCRAWACRHIESKCDYVAFRTEGNSTNGVAPWWVVHSLCKLSVMGWADRVMYDLCTHYGWHHNLSNVSSWHCHSSKHEVYRKSLNTLGLCDRKLPFMEVEDWSYSTRDAGSISRQGHASPAVTRYETLWVTEAEGRFGLSTVNS